MSAILSTSMTVLTKPSTQSFEAVKNKVSTNGTLIAIAIAGAISGFLGKVLSGDVGAMVVNLILGAIFGAIFGVIGYYIGQAILWIFAKLFGGKGNLTLQANLLATFVAPLTVVTSILGLIPAVGWILNFLVWLYELVLLTFGLQVAHDYTRGKAVLTWLVPLIILLILLLILFLILGVALLSLIGVSSTP